MKNNNVARLEACYKQAQGVLEVFDAYFQETAYQLTSLSLGSMEVKNENGEKMTFLFSNDYYYGVHPMPLQEIIIIGLQGQKKTLSQCIKERDNSTSIYQLIGEKGKAGINRVQAFKELFEEYLKNTIA